MALKFTRPGAAVLVPDGQPPERALGRTTRLGVGAHQDDLECMAYDGIYECFGSETEWFSGVICTDGAGSPRTGPYADYDGEAMVAIRRREQETAAIMGRFGLIAQLGHPSGPLKDGRTADLAADLRLLLEASRPDVVYTHHPADKHSTHVAVFAAFLEACRSLPPEARPKRVLGCEAWRNLDWLPDRAKVILDCSGAPHLAAALIGIFDSQIRGGKRYDLAVMGRRVANATFLEPRQTDQVQAAAFAMDLTPLVENVELSPLEFVEDLMEQFRQEVRVGLSPHL